MTSVFYKARQDEAKFLWLLTYRPSPHFHVGFIIANFILHLIAPSVHCTIAFICLMTRHSKTILGLNYTFFKFSKCFSIYIFLRIRDRSFWEPRLIAFISGWWHYIHMLHLQVSFRLKKHFLLLALDVFHWEMWKGFDIHFGFYICLNGDCEYISILST